MGPPAVERDAIPVETWPRRSSARIGPACADGTRAAWTGYQYQAIGANESFEPACPRWGRAAHQAPPAGCTSSGWPGCSRATSAASTLGGRARVGPAARGRARRLPRLLPARPPPPGPARAPGSSPHVTRIESSSQAVWSMSSSTRALPRAHSLRQRDVLRHADRGAFRAGTAARIHAPASRRCRDRPAGRQLALAHQPSLPGARRWHVWSAWSRLQAAGIVRRGSRARARSRCGCCSSRRRRRRGKTRSPLPSASGSAPSARRSDGAERRVGALVRPATRRPPHGPARRPGKGRARGKAPTVRHARSIPSRALDARGIAAALGVVHLQVARARIGEQPLERRRRLRAVHHVRIDHHVRGVEGAHGSPAARGSLPAPSSTASKARARRGSRKSRAARDTASRPAGARSGGAAARRRRRMGELTRQGRPGWSATRRRAPIAASSPSDNREEGAEGLRGEAEDAEGH